MGYTDGIPTNDHAQSHDESFHRQSLLEVRCRVFRHGQWTSPKAVDVAVSVRSIATTMDAGAPSGYAPSLVVAIVVARRQRRRARRPSHRVTNADADDQRH